MAHTTIKRIIKRYTVGRTPITLIEYEDGGEIYEATGVGHDYTVGTSIVTFLDDRYGRIKFKVYCAHPSNT